MGRKEERIRKKLEKNPVAECNRVQQRFYPQLFEMFASVKDPRHQSYITYDTEVMLGTLYYKCLGGISSMQDMTRSFNNEKLVSNLYHFMGVNEKEYLPHGVTENEFLEKLEVGELEKIQHNLVYSMIRRKSFDDAKILKKWLVIVDGTELDEGFQKKNEHYLSRCYNRGTERETVKYHRSMLEAKIYFGDRLLCSIASETIENSEEYIHQSDDTVKQDCEIKAFERLARKIKDRFPRLPICIAADGLYVQHRVMDICTEYGWDYILRYKEGCASSIAKEYRALPEVERLEGGIEYQNEIIFGAGSVNLIYLKENKIIGNEEKQVEFAFITNIKITRKNAKKIVYAGRKRWKIENQGFNRQKKWQGNITHACSWNENAQKNHYLMEQIADFIKQLYEYYFLEKNEIKKTQKNISSELLASFGRQLTSEDISQNDMHSISTL